MTDIIGTISIDKYTELLGLLFPGSFYCGLYSNDYRLIWFVGDQALRENEDHYLSSYLNRPNAGRQNEPPYTLSITSSKTLIQDVITDIHGENAGILQIICEHHHLKNQSPESVVGINRFTTLKALLENEYRLLLELDKMSEELADRYDELNLVYDTIDQVHHFDECQATLQKIVENCCEYLNVPEAILFLSKLDLQYTFRVAGHNDKASHSDRQCDYLTDSLLTWISEHRTTLVINQADDPMKGFLSPNLQQKLIAAPIFDAHGTFVGVLALFNSFSACDFTNSDKSLLDVLSKKVTKILLAHYDDRTSLIKREGFEYFMGKCLQQFHENHEAHCHMHIDIDNLQVVNETVGLSVGDRIIVELAQAIKKRLRRHDVLSYIGNGQFKALLYQSNIYEAKRVADNINKFAQIMSDNIENYTQPVTVSIGITLINSDALTVHSIINNAELACEKAKEQGKGRAYVFDDSDAEMTSRKDQLHWVHKIQSALRENRFHLYAQGIIPIKNTDEKPHYEILIRMSDENANLIFPGDFIPTAERYNLMTDIDLWVIVNSLKIIDKFWPSLKPHIANFAINLSGQTINDERMLDNIISITDKYKHLTPYLGFELTETIAVSNLSQAQHFITRVSQQGIQFSLDDFGAGMSSFNYLKQLPVDYLKIDGGLVKNIIEDSVSDVMVSSIQNIAQAMNLKTIAEFVENEAISNRLKSMGIDYAQGYFYSQPMPIESLIKEHTSVSPFLGNTKNQMSA